MSALKRLSLSLLLLTILTGCASLPETIQHTVKPKMEQPVTTLSELVAAQKIPSEKSAILLQDSGWDALAQRIALIESAEHSIDVQYYIWNSDVSGRYLASRLMAAAERGVHVRVMLDDMNINERESLLATLDAHPRIDIRIFNPTPSRRGLAKWFNFAGDFSRLNRRMHNKSFTVDGALSVVGGRNIGDEYFDLSDEINFRDRDVLVMGKVVADIQTSFAHYWNSSWSYPINLLTDAEVLDFPTLDAVQIPDYRHYPSLPVDNNAANSYLTRLMDKFTSVNARFVSDIPVPEDASDTSKPKTTARVLAELAHQSKQQVLVESAYLIFDDRQLGALQALTNKGIEVKALTNSMASNDLIANHSGYAGRRFDMLENGLQLFELKPSTTLCEASTKDKSKCAPLVPYGLHSKSVVFDRQIAVIGSFNVNLRSTYLNTESILVIENHDIAEAVAVDIEQAMDKTNSWRLDLQDGDIHWHSGDESWEHDPETGQWERIKSGALQLLPIEKYL